MLELSEQNVVDYLRRTGRASDKEVLAQSLSGGVANIVLKIFDTGAGEKIGSDVRTPGQIKLGKPDNRPHAGLCYVIKQPLPKFKTQAEWLVDIDRVLIERDCMLLLNEILPRGSAPEVLWFDEAENVLAISCAPADAVIWKKSLLDGSVSLDAAQHAGMLLAMMHSHTLHDGKVRKRFGDPRLFMQQRIDAYLHATAARHADLNATLHNLGEALLNEKLCLIHGDFSPKNIFVCPQPDDEPDPKKRKFVVSHLMLLDFEVAFFSHPAFDVATLLNHMLLKGWHHGKRWRPFMMAADTFWTTYQSTAHKELVRAASHLGGHMLAALHLARVDGKSPVEYITDEAIRAKIRDAARRVLLQKDTSLDYAIDTISSFYPSPD